MLFRSFELALRTYHGDDPFEPWFQYILWTEQTFQTNGKDLNTLLEKCIQKFKGNEVYNQDPRFFEVWMKYVRPCSYNLVFNNFLYSRILSTISGQSVEKSPRSVQLHVH